jgi:Zn2+/Cd2+-exporting ATPase
LPSAALKAQSPVAMVGDGINDAPAQAALETANAALLSSRVTDVAALVGLSRETLANSHQNVAVAFGLKAVFVVTTLAGATGLWPAVLGGHGRDGGGDPRCPAAAPLAADAVEVGQQL